MKCKLAGVHCTECSIPLSPILSFFICPGLFTVTGVSLYIEYSNKAMEEFQRVVAPKELAYVKVSFGWSFTMTWISFALELAAGLLLLLAAKITQMSGRYDCGMAVTL